MWLYKWQKDKQKRYTSLLALIKNTQRRENIVKPSNYTIIYGLLVSKL